MNHKTMAAVSVTLAATASHALTDAKADARISDGYNLTQYDTGFGTRSLKGDVGNAAVTIGQDANLPYIAFAASTSRTTDSNPNVSASLSYSWEITTLDGKPTNDLVPVTISSSGWFSYSYDMVPKVSGVYNLAPNYMTIGMSASFNTYVGGPLDQHALGMTMGALNWGVERVPVPSGAQTKYEYKVEVDAGFNQSFSVMARPNYENTVVMQAYAAQYTYWPNYPAEYAQELWAYSAYIDPVITVDPAYADRYAVMVSAIPNVPLPVPEPDAWLLFMAGAALLGSLKGRVSRRAPRSARAR